MFKKSLVLQKEEMLKHRWIRSEQEHHDMGVEMYFEWVNLYAEDWRKEFIKEYMKDWDWHI